MSRSDEELVADILEASRKLSEIVTLGRENYDRNWVVRSAVERQLEIIGVAAGNLSEDMARRRPDLPIRTAKAMRNLISHEYFNVSCDIVWETIVISVPEFASLISEEI